MNQEVVGIETVERQHKLIINTIVRNVQCLAAFVDPEICRIIHVALVCCGFRTRSDPWSLI